MKDHVIVWFRQDLRVKDNPALQAAAVAGQPVIPLYIHSPEDEADWAPGGASRWWLHHALTSLTEELSGLGLKLVLLRGGAENVLSTITDQFPISTVYWNRRYEPDIIARDTRLKKRLREEGLTVETFNSALLYEPHEISNKSGQPFRVFTPFWKHLRSLPQRGPTHVDTRTLSPATLDLGSLDLAALDLLPKIHWDAGLQAAWDPSIAGGIKALESFVNEHAERYKAERNLPGVNGTSRLSPYLHFGQLGPRQVWDATVRAELDSSPGGFTFLSEVAWREFGYHLLYHFPHTPADALNSAYKNFPWVPDAQQLHAWQTGMTGYPIVDAGMRELWQTGWMHNRVRMITASFLVKHLLQPWQEGARWFWDTLVDADLASNTMGWQWTAGCGADAAPYFRIFNPMLQGDKFDPEGQYVRRYITELSALPNRYIHQPWEAPGSTLSKAGVTLGREYPERIIDHKVGRDRALAALQTNKSRHD